MLRALRDRLLNGKTKRDLHDLTAPQLWAYLEAVWELWRRPETSSVFGRAAPTAMGPARVTVGFTPTLPPVPNTPPAAGARLTLTPALAATPNPLDPNLEALLGTVRDEALDALRDVGASAWPYPDRQVPAPWPHLMYAYLVENTKAHDVFRALLATERSDETLGLFSAQLLQWLDVTEEAFFRDGEYSLVASITSHTRRDAEAVRRNAYERMFGMTLNHALPEDKQQHYRQPTVANGQFRHVLRSLLLELSVAHDDVTATAARREMKEAKIIDLIEQLRVMMRVRRAGRDGFPILAREEFVACATMQWLELALESGLLRGLNIQAETRDVALKSLAQKVNEPVHRDARSFFALTHPPGPVVGVGALPRFLREIEDGLWATRAMNRYLFDPGTGTAFVERTEVILDHWAQVTGENFRAARGT